MASLTRKLVLPTDDGLIHQIAEWYFKEWGISKERTTQRLTTQLASDIHFHVVLMQDNTPVATGGLYNRVGLLFEQPRFKVYGPWVGLVYTPPENRRSGLGGKILHEVEVRAAELGFSALYLYTHTAESLYRKNGWTTFETTEYQNHQISVMKKVLKLVS